MAAAHVGNDFSALAYLYLIGIRIFNFIQNLTLPFVWILLL
jgi:hypothetical protein